METIRINSLVCTNSLIRKDADRVDQPISSLEGLRVVLHILSTSLDSSFSGSSISLPGVACPITTQFSVDDELHVLEVRVKVAAVAREYSLRLGGPGAGVGLVGFDVGGDVLAREEVDADAC